MCITSLNRFSNDLHWTTHNNTHTKQTHTLALITAMAKFFFRNLHTHSQTAYLCNSADQIFLVFNWLPFFQFIYNYIFFVLFKLIRIPLSLILFQFLQAAYPLDHYCTHLYIYYKISRIRIANEIEKETKLAQMNGKEFFDRNRRTHKLRTNRANFFERIQMKRTNRMNNWAKSTVDWRAVDSSSQPSNKINNAVILGPYSFFFFFSKYTLCTTSSRV